MQQGAVGQVRLTEHDGRPAVEKRFRDPRRRDVEALALRALTGQGLPVPELLAVGADTVVMTLLPGARLDGVAADVRLAGLRASGTLLRRLHVLVPPPGLPPAPDDALTLRRYRDAGGPPLPPVVPPTSGPAVFCHGDWTDGNLLAQGTTVTGVVDWEAAHTGDPLREVARAAWGAARKDPRSVDAVADGYGVGRDALEGWFGVHAAELWLWFAEVGPPEHLTRLTHELTDWPYA